jgi:hypothetical protein
MPNPHDVSNEHFRPETVIYQARHFSIAWGETPSGRRLGMRWDDIPGDAGYPHAFGHPMWFVVAPALSVPILRTLLSLRCDDDAILVEDHRIVALLMDAAKVAS